MPANMKGKYPTYEFRSGRETRIPGMRNGGMPKFQGTTGSSEVSPDGLTYTAPVEPTVLTAEQIKAMQIANQNAAKDAMNVGSPYGISGGPQTVVGSPEYIPQSQTSFVEGQGAGGVLRTGGTPKRKTGGAIGRSGVL